MLHGMAARSRALNNHPHITIVAHLWRWCAWWLAAGFGGRLGCWGGLGAACEPEERQ